VRGNGNKIILKHPADIFQIGLRKIAWKPRILLTILIQCSLPTCRDLNSRPYECETWVLPSAKWILWISQMKYQDSARIVLRTNVTTFEDSAPRIGIPFVSKPMCCVSRLHSSPWFTAYFAVSRWLEQCNIVEKCRKCLPALRQNLSRTSCLLSWNRKAVLISHRPGPPSVLFAH
jgi:hypothetical protein